MADLKQKREAKTLFQNLKMTDNLVNKSKKSMTKNNVSRDILEKIHEIKQTINELENIANEY